jgi:proteasome activator-like protein
MDAQRKESSPQVVGVTRLPTSEQQEAKEPTEAISSPAKIMRIGSMVRQLLEEVRHAPLDQEGRTRMGEIYSTSVEELRTALSGDLAAELDRITPPLDKETPSEAELRVAQAQLVGWLEGLFHGIQATLFAQQVNARNQLAEMRSRGLPRPPEESLPGQGQYL